MYIKFINGYFCGILVLAKLCCIISDEKYTCPPPLSPTTTPPPIKPKILKLIIIHNCQLMESQKNKEVKIIYTYLFKSNCKKPHLQKTPQILLNDRTVCYQSLSPPPKKQKTKKTTNRKQNNTKNRTLILVL